MINNIKLGILKYLLLEYLINGKHFYVSQADISEDESFCSNLRLHFETDSEA